MAIGIALDLGSSGFRALAIDLSGGDILEGASTLCHPLPGANVIDHILFALTCGQSLAHSIVIKTISQLIGAISMPGEVELIAACGNPIQLGLLTNEELRDLVFSQDALERKGIAIPKREGRAIDAVQVGIDAGCELLIPPSIKAEVGADAVAMISKSGMLGQKSAIAIDFGTNAEMAIKSGDGIFAGSAAAGPAIEGQHIGHGVLASPGAICGLEYDWGWKCKVLDEGMHPQDGDIVDLADGRIEKRSNIRATGITGTGVLALVSVGLEAGYIDPPRIVNGPRRLSLQDGIDFGEGDLLEAGKAFGAIRAGCGTLASKANIPVEDIDMCFMAGAAGSFADPQKARNVGLIPGYTKIVHQLGNTSLEMAVDLATGKETLDGMQVIADKAIHISFSASEMFKRNYLREYAYWCEGARSRYQTRKAARPNGSDQVANGQESKPEIRIVKADNKMPASKVKYLRPAYYVPASGPTNATPANSSAFQRCVQVCPKRALKWKDGRIEVDLRRCLGASCLRCERACPGFKLGANQ